MLSLLSPGKPAELQRKESTDRHPFQHGDKVKCLLDIDILREMQEGHGGWNPKMAEVCPWILPGLQFQSLPHPCTAQEVTRTSLCALKVELNHKYRFFFFFLVIGHWSQSYF